MEQQTAWTNKCTATYRFVQAKANIPTQIFLFCGHTRADVSISTMAVSVSSSWSHLLIHLFANIMYDICMCIVHAHEKQTQIIIIYLIVGIHSADERMKRLEFVKPLIACYPYFIFVDATDCTSNFTSIKTVRINTHLNGWEWKCFIFILTKSSGL